MTIMTPGRLVRGVSIGIMLSVGAQSYAGKQTTAVIELSPGDYELTVSSDSTGRATQEAKGDLVVRPLIATRQLFGTPCRLYGWTKIDFQALGAPVGTNVAASQDPENPGVLVWEPLPTSATLINSMNRKIVHPPGAPIMLVGTVENRRATRGFHDGAGIGLFVDSKQGQCLSGRWTHFGIVAGTEGRFKMCLRAAPPPNKALNPTGLRPTG